LHFAWLIFIDTCPKSKGPLIAKRAFFGVGFGDFFNVALFGFSWNNGLREAVVSRSFLFLSTFFIQVLYTSYKVRF
jgi:hypothetical protein